jgi:hypothetical protein
MGTYREYIGADMYAVGIYIGRFTIGWLVRA